MFENLKLKNLIKKSAEEIGKLNKLLGDVEELKPARDAKQIECESAALLREGCRLSRGPMDRLTLLDREYRRLEAERDGPMNRAKLAVEKLADIIRRISQPITSAFNLWGRATIQVDPNNFEFVDYIHKAISEIDSMSLKPLEKIIDAIERHQRKIEEWTFAEKLKNPIPMFRLQDAIGA